MHSQTATRRAAIAALSAALPAQPALPYIGTAVAVALSIDLPSVSVIATSDTGKRKASGRVKLFPAGKFAARDGRPATMTVDAVGQAVTVGCTHWVLTNDLGYRLAELLNQRHGDGKASFGFDYEHSTMTAIKSGTPAPRSGSGTHFEWIWDDGLYITDVIWTAEANNYIISDSYKYVSPVFFFDQLTGEVLDLYNAALVNTPALMSLGELSVADCSALARAIGHSTSFQPSETPPMDLLAQLLGKLGLPATTKQDAALTALSATLDAAKVSTATVTAVAAALGADPKTATADQLVQGITQARTGQAVAVALGASLKLDAAALADPAKAGIAAAALAAKAAGNTGTNDAAVTAIAALSAEVAALQAKVEGKEREDLVSAAMAQGKITPAMEPWARQLTPVALAAYLQAAPVIAPPAGGQQGRSAANPAPAVAAAAGDVEAVAKAFGLTSAALLAVQ